ncbi:MAG: hypothetical protein Q4G18_03355 [Myroides sp.]|nr:hypothetical protein [Myroides sp.]
MATVQNSLIAANVSPPTMLPTIYVTVQVGDMQVIKRAVIDAAQTYYQPQGIPLGSIDIINQVGNYQRLLSQTNTINTFAYFTNNGSRIYRTAGYGVPVINGYVTKSTIDNDNFRVYGVKVGTATVIYRATAHNGTYESSSTMSVTGQIVIKVIGPNNRPNSLKAGQQEIVWNSITTLMGALFVNLYADPENDAPYQVKVAVLPTKGVFYYQGVEVVLNQEIPYSHIQQGLLVYDNDGSVTTIGSIDYFRHTVSDTGSQEFY